MYHNILLAYCTRIDHLIPELFFFRGSYNTQRSGNKAGQVATLSCVCRWHLSCGILFITHLEF